MQRHTPVFGIDLVLHNPRVTTLRTVRRLASFPNTGAADVSSCLTMPVPRDVHVRWRDDVWWVDVDGETEPRSSYTKRADAWRAACDIAQALGLEAVLHSRGGYIRDRARFR